MADQETRDQPSRRRGARRSRAAVTIADVAERAEVSLMTVSRVMNDKGNVKEETRARVQKAIEELNYSPSAAARNLAAAGEILIGLLYANPSAGYLNEFLVGSLDQANKSGAQLLVQLCDAEAEVGGIVRRLIGNGIDGIVLPPPLCDDETILQLLLDSGTPTVVVASGKPSSALSAVNIDDLGAAEAMTRHLVALGHRRIGFIKGNPNQSAGARRLQGFHDALAASGIAVDEDLILPGLFTYRSGVEAAHRLLERERPPTAIFASNDDMAAATVTVAHRLGFDVPGDLTVVGFDDAPQATFTWPELTTIRQPIAEMSRTAVQLLVEEIRGRREGRAVTPSHIQMPFEFIQRESDASPRQG
ncbi:LacI family DNA-binding transcriptional regulator [Novosphingobium resinovorum]|uniref:LacI family DNA-binding transcriptional regulator n=1 Tax=Novosphingobium resinovorum TaxID=158500 RepID=UPI002ED128DF|nr:LacI family DNA-binding transcriptional regulator [Novosphingobium resinovorum]